MRSRTRSPSLGKRQCFRHVRLCSTAGRLRPAKPDILVPFCSLGLTDSQHCAGIWTSWGAKSEPQGIPSPEVSQTLRLNFSRRGWFCWPLHVAEVMMSDFCSEPFLVQWHWFSGFCCLRSILHVWTCLDPGFVAGDIGSKGK